MLRNFWLFDQCFWKIHKINMKWMQRRSIENEMNSASIWNVSSFLLAVFGMYYKLKMNKDVMLEWPYSDWYTNQPNNTVHLRLNSIYKHYVSSLFHCRCHSRAKSCVTSHCFLLFAVGSFFHVALCAPFCC